jgi:hypothetical protein
MENNTIKRKYKVIVRNSSNKIEAMHTFESFENAIICFGEFHKRYSHYYKIIIEAIQL